MFIMTMLEIRESLVRLWTWLYDPQIGRFHTQDRFAEKYSNFSPYQYGANNPILFIDVNGDSLDVANDEASRADIKSLVKEKNQQYVKFNEDGRVSVDFGNMKFFKKVM